MKHLEDLPLFFLLLLPPPPPRWPPTWATLKNERWASWSWLLNDEEIMDVTNRTEWARTTMKKWLAADVGSAEDAADDLLRVRRLPSFLPSSLASVLASVTINPSSICYRLATNQGQQQPTQTRPNRNQARTRGQANQDRGVGRGEREDCHLLSEHSLGRPMRHWAESMRPISTRRAKDEPIRRRTSR